LSREYPDCTLLALQILCKTCQKVENPHFTGGSNLLEAVQPIPGLLRFLTECRFLFHLLLWSENFRINLDIDDDAGYYAPVFQFEDFSSIHFRRF